MTPVNLLLIAITALLSWMAFNNRKLADRLILWPPAIDRHRQYDRLVTYGFIHADWSHLIFNMITLFFFGGFIESVMVQLTGSYLTYPAFYIGALLVSILPSYLKNQKNPNYLSLGASGAVSAVLFAFILIKPWSIIWCSSSRHRPLSMPRSTWATASGWTSAVVIASTTAPTWRARRSV